MKRILLPALVALAAFALARGAAADTPFPAVHSGDVFVIAQTVTTDGSMHDYYKPGDTVVFRAYAVDGKNHKILTEAKYFYATIPGQPNVKFKYDPKAKTALGQCSGAVLAGRRHRRSRSRRSRSRATEGYAFGRQ